jgi:hypothetical protein
VTEKHETSVGLKFSEVSMTVITARITVAPDGTISGRAPGEVPAGEHEASITVADRPARQLPIEPFDVNDLPTHDLGPWPAGLSLRREDLYSDDGR